MKRRKGMAKKRRPGDPRIYGYGRFRRTGSRTYGKCYPI